MLEGKESQGAGPKQTLLVITGSPHRPPENDTSPRSRAREEVGRRPSPGSRPSAVAPAVASGIPQSRPQHACFWKKQTRVRDEAINKSGKD